jgi:acetyl esterase/lipase
VRALVRRFGHGVALAALGGLLAIPSAANAAPLMDWPDLLSRPLPKADAQIAYGPDKLQTVDLFLPRGAGPFRVVVMVHGGCWQTDVANRTIMSYAADDLRRRGIAVWNIEYRGVDRPGGGYPGTYQDVAAAADALPATAATYHLRLDHITALGHSAGGHLAMWLAARPRLPPASPLYSPHPLPIAAAISLAGLPDLRAVTTPDADACGPDPVRGMAGPASARRPDVYADTSPAELLPLGIPQTLITGGADETVPPSIGAAYAARARRAGDQVQVVVVPAQAHVEEITPGTPAWASAVEALHVK